MTVEHNKTYNSTAMFEALTDKFTVVLRRLGSKGRLVERDVDQALREIRLALLEADVNFKVARDLVQHVKERAVGKEVLESLSPGQQIAKIVYDELTVILGKEQHKLESSSKPPTVALLVGLQGSGKTTTAAKVALHLRRQGHRPLLIAADLKRPAAIEQLVALGRQLDVPVYHENSSSTAVVVATHGVEKARSMGATWAIVDTGGRLQVDSTLMEELEAIKVATSPHEILLVLDSMTGQEGVAVAAEFHSRVRLTGLILTKLDGDARGGSALSITQVTGVPVKLIGVGEKPDDLEPFFPDRLASRILGMGDVVSLVEKAQAVVDEKKALELDRKMRTATFDLEDFLDQIQQLRKMGSLSQLLDLVPGFSALSKRLPSDAMDEKHMKKVEAIIRSMTPKERRNADILDGSRRRRIAIGSGTTPQDVNQLLNQFRQSRATMKQIASGKMPAIRNLLRR